MANHYQIKDLPGLLAEKLHRNFNNFSAGDRPAAKTKLGIENLAIYGDLPTTNVHETDMFYVADASGDPAITSGWAFYWCTSNDPITWRILISEEGISSLSGEQIVSLINGQETKINFGNVDYTGYKVLTTSEWNDINNSLNSKATGLYGFATYFGDVSEVDFNPLTSDGDHDIDTPLEYVEDSVPILNINDQMISLSRYSYKNTAGSLTVTLHCKSLHLNDYEHIYFTVKTEYPISIFYPKI